MMKHSEMDDVDLHAKLKSKEILFAGNQKLKIYGLLTCASGKRMKKQNRVFFSNEDEALVLQYRPCGHCMRQAYLKWKYEII